LTELEADVVVDAAGVLDPELPDTTAAATAKPTAEATITPDEIAPIAPAVAAAAPAPVAAPAAPAPAVALEPAVAAVSARAWARPENSMEEILNVTIATLNLDVKNIVFSFDIKSVIAKQPYNLYYKSFKIYSATVL
jgi:hypothetical protein